MKKKIEAKLINFAWFLLIFLFFVSFFVQKQIFAEATIEGFDFPSVSKAMVLIEKTSKRVLSQKNKDLKLPMASTTKIVTALTVLENFENLDEEISVNSKAVGIEGTSIYLRKGEKLSTYDLLCGMLISSGNDAACELAYRTSGSIADFAKLMNKTAIESGAINSNFKNPHGLDEDDHYTTSYDLALICAKAMENPIFNKIISSTSMQIKGSGNGQGNIRTLINKNKLLKKLEGANGVKIGFTDNAGRCLVFSATRNNMTLIGVVLNCLPMFEESAQILNKGFEIYTLKEILPSYNLIKKVAVENGKKNEISVFSKRSFTFPLSQNENINLIFDVELPEKLTAPIKKEQIVGKVIIKLYDEILFEENIYTTDEVESTELLENVKQIIDNWRI